MLNKLGLAMLGLLVCAGTSRAATIVDYNFEDGNGTVDAIDSNLSATTFATGGGLNTSFANHRVEARGWNPSANATDAITNGDYWTFTITAAPGYQFDLTGLSLDEARESSTSPLMFQFWAGESFVGSATSTSAGPLLTNHSIAVGLNDLTSLAVRIAAWNAHDNGGNADWFVDNVRVIGTVERVPEASTVPEPASMLLVGGGLAGLVARRYRRRRP